MTISLIGAAATIIAALIGAFAAVHRDRPSGTFDQPSTRSVSRTLWVAGIITAGFVLAGIVVLLGFTFGKMASAREAHARQASNILQETQSYFELVGQGIAANKLYILPSVVMLVSVERSADGEHINSDRRTIYTLQILDNIDPSTNPNAFIEGYHSDFPIERIPGADIERYIEPNPDSKTWQVLFGAAKGSRHTVVTATHVVMPAALQPQHDVHMFKRLGPNEDAYCYPNFDGDIIEELVIVIQSDSLQLTLPNAGDGDAELQHADATIDSLHANLYTSNANGSGPESVVARFANLRKGDIAGLRFGWTKRAR